MCTMKGNIGSTAHSIIRIIRIFVTFKKSFIFIENI